MSTWKVIGGGLLAGVGALGIIWGMVLRSVWQQEKKVEELWREFY